MDNSVNYIDGSLEVTSDTISSRISADQIVEICICRLADEALQGDEEFHIVILDHEFWLIGPFVRGALKAIDDLISANPDILRTNAIVNAVPWAFRKRGFMGLKLFATPGLVRMPNRQIDKLRISREA